MTEKDGTDYGRLFNILPTIMASVGFDGLFRDVNPAWAPALGFPAAEMRGKPCLDFIHPDDRAAVARHQERLLAGEVQGVFEARFKCRDGGHRWFYMRCAADRDKGLIYAAASDITARKLTEEALRESEVVLRKILDRAPMSMAIVAMDGTIEYINSKAVETFGFPHTEIPNMDRWWALAYPDENYRKEVVERWMGRVYKAFEAKTEIEGGEYRVTCKDGSVKTCYIFGVIASGKVFVMFDDISKRVAAEQALRDSERTLRKILEVAPVAIGIRDLETGDLEFINDKFTQTFGYAAGDILAFTDWVRKALPAGPFVGTEPVSAWQDLVRMVRANGNTFPVGEYALTCKDGTVKTAVLRGVVTPDDKMLGIFDDISERVRSEQALRESERTLRRVLEQAPTAIAIHDFDGKIEFVNRKFSETFGYRHEDIPTLEAWVTQAYPDQAYREKLVKIWSEWTENSVRTGREMTGGEFEVVCKDGSVKTSFITGIVTPDKKVLSLLEDVTARVEAERALRERESLYRALVETTRTGYVVIDGGGKVLDANREYVHLTGHSDLKDIMGRSVLEWTAPYHTQKNGEALAQCAREGRILNFEVDYADRAGGVVPVEINATVVSRNGVPQILALCRDIKKRREIEAQLRVLNQGLEKRVAERTAELTAANTELTAEIEQRRRAEEARKKLQEELLQSQKMEVVGRLAGGIAHDFNNILGAISGYAEFLLKSMPEGAPAREDLSEILGETERGSLLTRQLMAISRKQPLEPKVLSVNLMVEDSCRMLRRLIGPGIQIEQVLAQQVEPIKADPGQVSQVLMNLIVNARDAMPDGGRITVFTGNEDLGAETRGLRLSPPPGRYAVLTVSDTGTGMSAETAAHAFDPFFTTKEKGKGTGLGLSTVYGIVSQTGGGIALDTAPGKGCTFKIYFPATQERA